MKEKYEIVFTNGCFDILHRGHIELLQYCSNIGNKVIVGLNSDKSIRKIKGCNRPIFSEQDRQFLLESIQYVNEVIIFDEETPYEIIKKIRPDILVKGGDYEAHDVIGNNLCEVRIFNYVNGYSTTKAIQDIVGR